MLVSIIMPFYKKKNFLSKSIDSILAQTYKDFEVIIIYDDNSLDDFDYVKNFENLDKRIRVIKNNSNIGAGESRNKGIINSSGKYVAFLDCDDLWKSDKLEIQINFMIENKLNFSSTSYEIIDHEDNYLGIRNTQNNLEYKDLIKSCDIGLSTVVLKKDLINEECKFANLKTKEDYVLWLKLARKNIKFHNLSKTLTQWRKLDNSLSSNTFQKIFDGYRVYRHHMNYSILRSLFYLFRLSINYLKKK